MDIAFAMKANGSDIKAEDNIKGYYCGTCHNGIFSYEDKKVFEACSREFEQKDVKRCERRHSYGRFNVKREYDFTKFTERFPKERFGNGIDWVKALRRGLITPVNYLDIKPPEDVMYEKTVTLEAEWSNIPPAVFPHKPHNEWLDCNMCHPDIFNIKKKTTKHFYMTRILKGEFCGVCHLNVAFPMNDCKRCHPGMRGET